MTKVLVGLVETLDKMIADAVKERDSWAAAGFAGGWMHTRAGTEAIILRKARAAMTEVDDEALDKIADRWRADMNDWEYGEPGLAPLFSDRLLAHIKEDG